MVYPNNEKVSINPRDWPCTIRTTRELFLETWNTSGKFYTGNSTLWVREGDLFLFGKQEGFGYLCFVDEGIAVKIDRDHVEKMFSDDNFSFSSKPPTIQF